MTTPIFPILPGQGFGVKKKPTMSTIVANHVSGREVRASLYQNPLWQFEIAFNGLDGSLSGQYPGLGSQSLQSLLGLFLQCGGRFGTFIYYDPTDYLAAGQQFGVGDGATTSFQLTRTIGAFTEDVVAPFAPSAPTLFALPGSTFWAPNNEFTGSYGAPPLFGALVNVTFSSPAPGPLPGLVSSILTETAVTGSHGAQQTGIAVPAGVFYIWSIYLKNHGSQYWQLILDDGGSNGLVAVFDVVNGVAVSTQSAGAASNLVAGVQSVGSGWYRCWISGLPVAGVTSLRASLVGNNNSSVATYYPTYAGSTGHSVYVSSPQVEVSSAPGAPSVFNPTLASPYFGGPQIIVAGSLVDATTYSISNGVVTFAAAPPSGSALIWSGYFGFLCRFDDDSLDLDQFMSNMWQVESLKFRSVRTQ